MYAPVCILLSGRSYRSASFMLCGAFIVVENVGRKEAERTEGRKRGKQNRRIIFLEVLRKRTGQRLTSTCLSRYGCDRQFVAPAKQPHVFEDADLYTHILSVYV